MLSPRPVNSTVIRLLIWNTSGPRESNLSREPTAKIDSGPRLRLAIVDRGVRCSQFHTCLARRSSLHGRRTRAAVVLSVEFHKRTYHSPCRGYLSSLKSLVGKHRSFLSRWLLNWLLCSSAINRLRSLAGSSQRLENDARRLSLHSWLLGQSIHVRASDLVLFRLLSDEGYTSLARVTSRGG